MSAVVGNVLLARPSACAFRNRNRKALANKAEATRIHTLSCQQRHTLPAVQIAKSEIVAHIISAPRRERENRQTGNNSRKSMHVQQPDMLWVYMYVNIFTRTVHRAYHVCASVLHPGRRNTTNIRWSTHDALLCTCTLASLLRCESFATNQRTTAMLLAFATFCTANARRV